MPLARRHVETLRMICALMVCFPALFFFLHGTANLAVLVFRLTLMFTGIVGYVWCEWRLKSPEP